MRKVRRLIIFLFPFGLLLARSPGETPSKLALRDQWSLRSSAEVAAPPEVLSSVVFTPGNWLQVRIPATALAAQVAHRPT